MARAVSEEVRIGSRDEQRFAVGAVVEALGRQGRFLVQVVDLSLTGARVRCWSHCLSEGDPLQLDLSLAPQRACIVWAQGSLAGCQFHAPLDPLDLKIILKALTPKQESCEPRWDHIDFAAFDQPGLPGETAAAAFERGIGRSSAYEMAREMVRTPRPC